MLDWLELNDVERRRWGNRTWIPLRMSRVHLIEKAFGIEGYRKDAEQIKGVIVFQTHQEECSSLGWQDINSRGFDRASVDDETFHPPSAFYDANDVVIGFYPVLYQGFDSGEPWEWHLAQELELALNLLRRGDVWIRPEEDNIDVVKLKRDAEGRPETMEIRAELLRDYLCARKASFFLTGYRYRDATERILDSIGWTSDQVREFDGGKWRGFKRLIVEGGMQVGSQTAVLHVRRESVDPSEDVPVMPDPTEDVQTSSEYLVRHEGPQLEFTCGQIWWKEWIEPAALSPRIKRDKVESTVPFIVDNQSRRTLSGKALAEYRGWLWFRSGVIPALLERPSGCLEWYTQSTGKIGPAQHETIHFGLNSLGLVNALAYKIVELAEWAQRLWAGFNIPPEGGLSEELHASQNLASPVSTIAPETMLWANLNAVQSLFQERFGATFFSALPDEATFFRAIHRFYDQSFRQVCELAKELMKIVVERIEMRSINLLLGPSKSEVENDARQIKRLKHWFDRHGHDGRKITGPLVGVNDLRQGAAHAGESKAKAGLEMFGFPKDSTDFQAINFAVIASVAWSLGWIAKTVEENGAIA